MEGNYDDAPALLACPVGGDIDEGEEGLEGASVVPRAGGTIVGGSVFDVERAGSVGGSGDGTPEYD